MQLSIVLTTALAALVSAGDDWWSEIATADKVTLYAAASAYAEAELASLSAQCATATGAEATSLSSAYESLKAEASSANAVAAGEASWPAETGSAYPTAPSGYPWPETDGAAHPTGGYAAPTGGYAAPTGGYGGSHGNGSSPSAPIEQTGNGAAATAVPVALGAVGMAVIGLL